MRGQRTRRYLNLLLLTVVLALSSAGSALALSSQSPNFELVEPEFGAGSALESCTGQYCANASIGDLSTGETTRSASTAAFGRITTDSEPLLEVIIEEGDSNLGVLTTETTGSKTTTIKIRTYLSDGYTLQIIGDPPKYENYTLQTPDSPTASIPGTEQFAINAAANTTPSVGAEPVQKPADDISFGYVLDSYKTPNRFMYRDGDVVARSDSETGQTEYTISMIVNVSESTPAGHFAADFAAIIMPTF